MAAIIVVFCGWIIFMAFDARRFGWSHTPWWAQALGAALIVGAFYGWVRVLKANSFASVTLARSGGTWPDGHLDRPLRRRAASDVHLYPASVYRHTAAARLPLGSVGRGVVHSVVGSSRNRRGGHAHGRTTRLSGIRHQGPLPPITRCMVTSGCRISARMLCVRVIQANWTPMNLSSTPRLVTPLLSYLQV